MLTETMGIGELAESTLHNQLKYHYLGPTDIMEYKLDGYFIDVKREDELVEIQTSSFGSVKKKYSKLMKNGHTIRMVYPIAREKYIVKFHSSGKRERRKSPKRGRVYDAFLELVSIPHFLSLENFKLDIVMVVEEETRVNDGKGSWKRQGWSIQDHKCIEIIGTYNFNRLSDFNQIIPETLPNEFTTQDISSHLKIPKWLAQKMTYTLTKAGFLHQLGKSGRYNLYEIVP